MKFIKGLLTALAVLIFVSIPLFLYLLRFGKETSIGKSLRSYLARYPQILSLVRLNEAGDGKYLYLNPDLEEIPVAVYSVGNIPPDSKIKVWIKEIISESIGKEALVLDTAALSYDTKEVLTDDDLSLIRQEFSDSDDLYKLNIVYVNRYASKPSAVGLVLHKDTIFIFKDAIADLSEKGYVNDVLEKTTLMHEWGHLLGLEHLEFDYCIMSEKVEVFDNPPAGKALPLKYCREELEMIKAIKKDIFPDKT